MAIWYRIHPAAQMSAFSVYGSLCTNSGLEGGARERGREGGREGEREGGREEELKGNEDEEEDKEVVVELKGNEDEGGGNKKR